MTAFTMFEFILTVAHTTLNNIIVQASSCSLHPPTYYQSQLSTVRQKASSCLGQKQHQSSLPTSNLTEFWKPLQTCLSEKKEKIKESGTEHSMIVKQCKQKNRSIFTSQFTAHVSEVPDLTLPLFPALLLLYQFSLITEKLWANLDKSALELTRNLAAE